MQAEELFASEEIPEHCPDMRIPAHIMNPLQNIEKLSV